MDPRTINFNVLRRHDPEITSIVDSTSYAVIYRYFHGAWSKTGFEGTMFIFQRSSPPLYGVFVLNRQGLENLCEGLLPGWDVDLDEGLIIWRSAGATGDADDDVIYGIWVYEEKDRSRISSTMQSLIDTASTHHDAAPATATPPPVSLSHPVPRVPIIPAGQSISLDQLFGVGSVCSEPPPPQASSLPHPAGSVVDSSEEKEPPLPTQVMSPDPSDLPKGMQLLDSLFQKAGLKSRITSNQPPPLETAAHPISFQHLMDLGSATSNHQQLQPNTTNLASKPSSSKREPRRSSNDTHYKQQVHSDGSLNHVQRASHQRQHPPRPDPRSNLGNVHALGSRRSSGGSSSNCRQDRSQITVNIDAPHHPVQGSHPYPSQHATFVPAPVPIENANAEARQNILTLLGHPAATKSADAYGPATGSQGHNLSPGGVPSGPSGVMRNGDGSPESLGSLRADVYAPYPRHLGAANLHIKASSQNASQHSSPQQYSANSVPVQPLSSKPTGYSPAVSRDGSLQDSPRGPRGPDQRHGSQDPLASRPQYLNSGPHNAGEGLGQNAWPLDGLPKRVLSPLNPASQQMGGVDSRLRHGHHSRKTSHQNSTPPHINDLSRPSRSHSYGSAPASHDSGPQVINTKAAAETMDEVLSETRINHFENQEEDSPLDKKSFVNAIDQLMKNNGAFVDTLYARYLARYAARYL